MENSMNLHGAWCIAGLAIVALFLLTFVSYQEAISYLLRQWNQIQIGTSTYGHLVVMFSACLVFYNRHKPTLSLWLKA